MQYLMVLILLLVKVQFPDPTFGGRVAGLRVIGDKLGVARAKR
jgi:hypothetical protein